MSRRVCGRRFSFKSLAFTILVLGLASVVWTYVVIVGKSKGTALTDGRWMTNEHKLANDFPVDKPSKTGRTNRVTRNINGEELVRRLVNPEVNAMSIVELNNSQPRYFSSSKLTLNFSYEMPDVTISESNLYQRYFSVVTRKSSVQRPMKWKGYISVRHFGQELSMCTKHLLKLVYLAASVSRKVVLPRMQGGNMGNQGVPFREFFNVSHLNQFFLRYGYSQLASEGERDRMCKNQPKTIVYVLYNTHKPSFLRQLTNDAYLNLFKKVERELWTECSGEPNQLNKGNLFFCVHPSIIKNMALLDQKVLKDATCIEIAQWNDPGKENWSYGVFLTLAHDFPSPTIVFNWFLKPSDAILDEAAAFQKVRLARPYVAIHMRAVKFHFKEDVPHCFKIALELVKAFKLTRNVKTLFLSTDMNLQYGSLANRDTSSHDAFVRQSGAVVYDPKVTGKVKVIDRWTVSLTEVQLLVQSDHLITIGYGSYHGFIYNRFLVTHLNQDRSTWSLTKLCFRTGMRPKAKPSPIPPQ